VAVFAVSGTSRWIDSRGEVGGRIRTVPAAEIGA
jgi:hypothetical protein